MNSPLRRRFFGNLILNLDLLGNSKNHIIHLVFFLTLIIVQTIGGVEGKSAGYVPSSNGER